MNTIEQLFQQAQLAEAAYGDLSEPTKKGRKGVSVWGFPSNIVVKLMIYNN